MPTAPDTAQTHQQRPARDHSGRSARAAWAAALALVVWCVLWELWWAPTGRGTLALKVLPVVLALPGLWRQQMGTYQWTSLVLWLYVTEGLVRATSDVGVSQVLAAVEVLLALALFAACAWHIRLQRLARAASA